MKYHIPMELRIRTASPLEDNTGTPTGTGDELTNQLLTQRFFLDIPKTVRGLLLNMLEILSVLSRTVSTYW